MNAIMQKERSLLLATLGFVLSLPALLLFISGMLQSFGGSEVMLLPEPLLHPVVILGGILLAGLLNAWATLRIRVEGNENYTTISLDIARKNTNLAVLGLTLFLLGAVLTYGFIENIL